MKRNLQSKVHDMITDNHYHVGIRPHFDPPLFSEVSHESGSRENDEENIIAHDGDGSINRNHRSYVEGQGTVLGNRSHYFFHYGVRRCQLAAKAIGVYIYQRTRCVDYTNRCLSLSRGQR
jgi:hypothetical protein